MSGQVARYLDDTHTRYGFLTTYNETFFVRRISNYRFEVSSPMRYNTVSRPDPSRSVSLREAFLYVAHLSLGAGSLWKIIIGLDLLRNLSGSMICCSSLNNHVF